MSAPDRVAATGFCLGDVVVLDTETIGLHQDAPVWEFAAVRRHADSKPDVRVEFQIRHEPEPWLTTMEKDPRGKRFAGDYRARYKRSSAILEPHAAKTIDQVTRGAIPIASNPGFDLTRLEALLRRNGIEPGWHFHPMDIPSLVLGYLYGAGRCPAGPPWKSDVLSDALGVNSKDYARHTAMGDVEWTLAQYESVTNL